MSTLVRHCSGDYRHGPGAGAGGGGAGGRVYAAGLIEAGLFLSLAPCNDVFYPPLKRARISDKNYSAASSPPPPKRKPCSLDALPDGCLSEILHRLRGPERTAAACVSKRWLMLLSSVQLPPEAPKNPLPDLNEDADAAEDDLHWCLEGKEATDTRLASMAIKHGGAGVTKVSLRSSDGNGIAVTSLGLRAVARSCPSLKALMVWNAPLVGDDGLAEIADFCPFLQKLDLFRCPAVSDKGLMAIAGKCSELSSLAIESCSKVSDKGLLAVGKLCPQLTAVTISDCPLVGDAGVAYLVSSAGGSLRKLKLRNLNVTDAAIAVVGYYGKEVRELLFNGLKRVDEKGFWVMGNTKGLKKLEKLTIAGCDGFTDMGLVAIAKGSPGLKQLSLRNCASLSDEGLQSLAGEGSAGKLETLRLEDCNGVTLAGGLVSGSNLTSITLVRCKGVSDSSLPCRSSSGLRSLTVWNCPGFGPASMRMIGKLCPYLQEIELMGLPEITDEALLPLLATAPGGAGKLTKINLVGCSNLTDASVTTMIKFHGSTLKTIVLDGCRRISDATMAAIVESCSALDELDVSGTSVSDRAIFGLLSARQQQQQLKVRVLSLSRCRNVTTRSFPVLCGLGKDLVGLNLRGCRSVNAAAVGALEERMWWCDILF